VNPTLRRIPSTFAEDETVQAADGLAIMTEGGRAFPFAFTGLSFDFGSITSPFLNVGIDAGSITSPSRFPVDFGTI
jgi:hypothetical protein